ncbi:hypothetical protein J4233_04790 [Candidatus Pacearchaeota archaeon]|nr:hypothetical protein [Candidatus Pacearchaeota archaeon]
MKKRQVTKVLLIAAVVAVTLFIVFNVNAFLRMKDFRGVTKAACGNFVEGDNCEFTLRNAIINGSCVKEKNGELTCRPSDPVFRKK